MRGGDYGRAALTALILAAAGLAVGVLTLLASSLLIEPGPDPLAYRRTAQGLVPWAVGIAGPILFGLAGYRAARRRRDRNPFAFAACFWAFYVLIDVGAGIMVGQRAAGLSPQTGLLLLANLIGALDGAWLGSARRRRSDPRTHRQAAAPAG